MKAKALRAGIVVTAALAMMVTSGADADSVAQVATAKRISRQTVALIDPQGRPVPGGGANTLAKAGDVLTFVVQFTPVPNGAYRGMGGYITDYIPSNTEVVSARIIDRDGNTVSPHRGGLACDGYGPRGKGNYSSPGATLVEGSMSQLYADTGIFYSRDPRTQRRSKNPVSGNNEPFLSLRNGVQMLQAPSGAGQFDQLLNTSSPYFAHNNWDLIQAAKWGPGNGNTPEHVGSAGVGYGSPVAGPDSWYQLEVTTPLGAIPDATASNVAYLGQVGPWQRIRQTGSEIGRRGQGATPPTLAQNTSYLQCPDSAPTRVGAVTNLGFTLSTSSPLPADTNAVRFALGELVVGDEYYAELSLRVKALPLDPTFGNINCAEVAGGDASSRAQDGGAGGKDHLWRYFVPAPACVSLDLLFENNVDKVLAVSGSSLKYTIEAKNLTTSTMSNVFVRDCFVAGNQTFVAAGSTAGHTIDATGAGCPSPGTQRAVVWNVGSLAPGEGKVFTVNFTGSSSTTNQAVFTSNTFQAPGFVANAYTTIGNLAVMRLQLAVSPSYVSTLPSVVRFTATVRNVGSAAATTTQYRVQLPSAAFTYVPGSTAVNGAAVVGNPAQAGAQLTFLPGASLLPSSIAAGATHTVAFDVQVPSGTTAGLYTSDLSTWVQSAQSFEDSVFKVAPLAVLVQRSEAPMVPLALTDGATSVSGKSSEANGSTVKVYVNGNVAGAGTVNASGAYSVTVPPLLGGQRVQITVTAAGELESTPAPVPPLIVAAKAINADPTPQPPCSDGVDNDNDGLKDFPGDPDCCSYLDDSEASGGAACAVQPECSDGEDNDGDGVLDFPFDPGCASPLDDIEDDMVSDVDAGNSGGSGGGSTGMAGSDDGGAAGSSGGSGGAGRPPGASPPDLGGVPEDEGNISKSSSGCGCRVVPESGAGPRGWFLAGLLGMGLLVRRRRLRERQPVAPGSP